MEIAFQYFVSHHVRDRDDFPGNGAAVLIDIEHPVPAFSL
jgi:hypothetical protein